MRDDFIKRTIDLLAKRAGYLCSNPECNPPTVGAGRSLSGTLNSAIRHAAVGERPSEDWAGATVSFSVEVSDLRKELFRMINGETAEGKLAVECLTAIDELRDEHGPAESEPRHPDIESGRAWPLV